MRVSRVCNKLREYWWQSLSWSCSTILYIVLPSDKSISCQASRSDSVDYNDKKLTNITNVITYKWDSLSDCYMVYIM